MRQTSPDRLLVTALRFILPAQLKCTTQRLYLLRPYALTVITILMMTAIRDCIVRLLLLKHFCSTVLPAVRGLCHFGGDSLAGVCRSGWLPRKIFCPNGVESIAVRIYLWHARLGC